MKCKLSDLCKRSKIRVLTDDKKRLRQSLKDLLDHTARGEEAWDMITKVLEATK